MLDMSNHNGLGDKVKAGVSKAKGELKDQIGNAKGDKSMQAEGKMDKAKGEVQDKIGDIKNRS